MQKELVCIVCPVGCNLRAELDDDQAVKGVFGNTCPRGDAYARKELTNPTRMLTSTVKIEGAQYERLPVITSSDIPKPMMRAVMEQLRHVVVHAPVNNRDVIVANVCGLNVDIIASRTMK
jgi:CxxC motif-containing protein